MGSPNTCLPYPKTKEIEKDISITIPEKQWQPSGPDEDPMSRMLCCIVINGTPHHLEAYAVTDDSEEGQIAAHESFEDNVNGAYMVGEPDKAFDTVTIYGRDYILVMTPYC
jgi:hypothetical protein